MTVLVRYSSLGDVVLTAAFTAALAPVCFVTLPRYHALVARFPGVVDVRGPDDPLPAGRVVDLHHSLRSTRLRADVRVERQDWARRARVWFKTAPAEPVLARYSRACGVPPAPRPWLTPAVRGGTLGVLPGAAHATKRWPHWPAFVRAWPGPVRAIGAPGEDVFAGAVPGTFEPGLDAALAAMDGLGAVVGGDTGLLHLAAAVGLPAVGLFGPTTSIDGFHDASVTGVELPLACRPCSRFGGATCPVGDHLCMRGLTVEAVTAAARAAMLTSR